MEQPLYLDTHVVVWLYVGEMSFFPARTLRRLEDGLTTISPIVRLELQYLREIGRITVKPETILKVLEGYIGLKTSGAQFDRVATEAMKQTWTHDPFDRIIVAQANLHQADLVTKDQYILKHYKKAVWE